jgi:hypothetical protein
MTVNAYQTMNRERLLRAALQDPDSGCWLWRGQISNSGYGRIMLSGPEGPRMESAHRASYLAFVGPIPEGGLIRQTCGNRLCVNPEHLDLQIEAQDKPSAV